MQKNAGKYIAIFSAAIALVFFISMFLFSGLHLSAPLDDAFIYMQYAKNTAAGHFLEYVRGEGYSSGATGFLYVLLLAPLTLIFKGAFLVIPIYFLSAFFLFITTLYIFKILKQLIKDEKFALFGAFLFATNGSLLWGYFSGMEIGLFSCLIVLSLYYVFFSEKLWLKLICLSLLALSRPEGFILTVLLAGLKGLEVALNIGKKSEKKNDYLWVYLLAVVAGFSYFIMNKIFTGDFMPDSMRSKSNFSLLYFYYPDIIKQGLADYLEILKKIFNGNLEYFFFHYMFLFFCMGALPGAWNELQQKKIGIYILAFFWFFIGLMSTVFSSFAGVHNYRYAMPFMTVFVIFAVIGIYQVFTAFVPDKQLVKKRAFSALVILLLSFNAFSIVANVINFGLDCKDIYGQSITAGKWIKQNIPADKTIALNDAGAIAYFSDAKIYDLVGLVTNGQAACFRSGNGSVYEEIERKKPDYYMIHLGWFNYEGYDEPCNECCVQGCESKENLCYYKYNLLQPRLAEFNLKRPPAYYIIGSPEICAPADQSMFKSGDMMKIDHSENGKYEQKDKIDVADLREEKAHAYKIWSQGPPDMPGSLLKQTSYLGLPNVKVLDGGRVTMGGESFTVENLTPGKALKIVRRTYSTPHNVIDVFVDGKKAGTWETSKHCAFTEQEFVVTGEKITSDKAMVRLEIKSKTNYNIFYYWFLEEKGDN